MVGQISNLADTHRVFRLASLLSASLNKTEITEMATHILASDSVIIEGPSGKPKGVSLEHVVAI
jgi:hypothetical protein